MVIIQRLFAAINTLQLSSLCNVTPTPSILDFVVRDFFDGWHVFPWVIRYWAYWQNPSTGVERGGNYGPDFVIRFAASLSDEPYNPRKLVVLSFENKRPGWLSEPCAYPPVGIRLHPSRGLSFSDPHNFRPREGVKGNAG